MSPPTNPENWPTIKALFEQLLALPAADREAHLVASGTPPDVQDEVRSLLQHSDQTLGLDAPAQALRVLANTLNTQDALSAGASATDATAQPRTDRTGQQLGAWRLTQLLGAGGMGEVWSAERADGAYQGRAAVKVLKRGLDSMAVLARFAQEKDALARLQHPHIAQLLDAGLSPDGMPYFVMAYIDGVPIDQAARDQPLAQRLKLFLQLADAVAHAHRHLLVHRDLKPANVLVDAQGQVKLLDFGIAKALDPHETQHTQVGERPFTPYYASPEQIKGEPITTATDVYSLGVLLYVLLTGERPYGREAHTPHEAAQAVLNEAPTRPSRLSHRATLPPNWEQTRKQLQGDLDNILLKALAKDPSERYASVDALAQDVRLYMDGFPVSAHTPSWRYTAGKFVRRHRWAVAGVSGATVSILAASGIAIWQGQQAQHARVLAEQRLQTTRQIVANLMERHTDALDNLPQGKGIKEQMLGDLVKHMDALAASTSQGLSLTDADREFKLQLAMAYTRWASAAAPVSNVESVNNDPAQSRQRIERALALFEQGAQEQASLPPLVYFWWSKAWTTKGFAERGLQQMLEARTSHERAIDTLGKGLAQWPQDMDLWREQGIAQYNLGQLHLRIVGAPFASPAKALAYLNQAMASNQRVQALLAAPDTPPSATTQNLSDKDRALSKKTYALDVAHQIATIEGGISSVHHDIGEFDAAVEHGLRSVNAMEELVKQRPDNATEKLAFLVESFNLAVVLWGARQPEQALKWAERSLQLTEDLVRGDPKERAVQDRVRKLKGLSLSRIWADNGQWSRAEDEIQGMLAFFKQGDKPTDRMRHAATLAEWAVLKKRQNQIDAARQSAREAVAGLREALAQKIIIRTAHLSLARTENLLAQIDEPAEREAWQKAHADTLSTLQAKSPINPREQRLLDLP